MKGHKSVYIRDPHASNRHGGLVVPVFGVNGGCHGQPLFGSEGFDAIDSRGMLALVLFLLRISPHCFSFALRPHVLKYME